MQNASTLTGPSALWFGLGLPLRALSLILGSPTLLFWSLLPIGATGALSLAFVAWAASWAHQGISAFLAAQGLAPEGALTGVATAIAWTVLLLGGALAFSSVASILAVPFNDVLAEKAEARASPPLAPAESASGRRWLRLLALDAMKGVVGAALSLLAIALSWIPGLNVLSFLLASAAVCFQFISYPQTRRGEGIREGARFVLRHPAASLGFGASLSLLFAIPFVSCLALPLAVVGGTLLYARAGAPPRHPAG